MKRIFVTLGLALGYACTAWAGPAPLTTLRAIHHLSNEEADRALPVAFEATVTYFRDYEATLFVEDDGVAIYVMATRVPALQPGDRVLIKGTTQPSFHPVVVSSDIAVLNHGSLPRPVPASFSAMVQGQLDCTYVAARGLVRSASITLSSGRHVTELELTMDGGNAGVTLENGDAAGLKGLLDSEVEVTGVASGRFDSKMQQTGVLIHASSIADIHILHPAPAGAESLPVTPMDKVLNSYNVEDRSRRVRVQGTITYFHPESLAVLQDGSRSIRVFTPQIEPLRIGDRADATGVPMVDHGALALNLGEIRSTGKADPIVPAPVTWDDLSSGKYAFNLVSIEGKVVTQVREHSQDVYVIKSGGHLFPVTMRHPFVYEWQPEKAPPPPPMPQIDQGSTVRVTGVAISDDGNPFNGAISFGILLRTSSDVVVLAPPSLLNIQNLTLIAGLLLAAVIVFAARGWALERKVRRHATTLATRIEAEADLERKRARILEDINGSRPLAEIVEQIAALVSSKLGGVACWCQVHDGARLGAYAPDAEKRGVASQEILSRSGARLGTLFAAVASPGSTTTDELEAMTIGAGLVELAIETRRLYSDLRHRSEFDQLTDIHNRFSLENRLNDQITEARETAGVFGLIYIDLDDFKQVNDMYGHYAGDLYLQQVAMRMKRQLRSGDMLARLGGDEFAVLVPEAHNREDVEEVATRLERSFDEPFLVNSYSLHGSASVGVALYPEDGTTKDTILSAADASMYVAKHTRRQMAQSLETQAQPGLEPKEHV
jgi:diguanylate cyclase (GGDEF)-like protein